MLESPDKIEIYKIISLRIINVRVFKKQLIFYKIIDFCNLENPFVSLADPMSNLANPMSNLARPMSNLANRMKKLARPISKLANPMSNLTHSENKAVIV